jgi:hypothetical protein
MIGGATESCKQERSVEYQFSELFATMLKAAASGHGRKRAEFANVKTLEV